MAVVKYITCDRCNRTIDEKFRESMTIRYADNNGIYATRIDIMSDRHLCQRCAKEFKIWFKK